jgi:hypothetical protein
MTDAERTELEIVFRVLNKQLETIKKLLGKS